MLMLTAALVVTILAFIRIIPTSVKVIDGDTLELRGRRLRLKGYDAPEWNQPGGSEATAHLKRILAKGWCIGIASGSDAYGRRVVRIITRKGPLAWRMMVAGHAWPDGFLGWLPTLYARIRRRGLWAGPSPIVSPKTWRALHPRGTPVPPPFAPKFMRKSRMRIRHDRKGMHIGGFTIP